MLVSAYQTRFVRFQASLFWDVTQHRLVVNYRRLGTTIGIFFQGQEIFLGLDP
jgi:hypothetical protein